MKTTRDKILDLAVLQSQIKTRLIYMDCSEPDSLGDQLARMSLRLSWACRTSIEEAFALESEARELLNKCEKKRRLRYDF